MDSLPSIVHWGTETVDTAILPAVSEETACVDMPREMLSTCDNPLSDRPDGLVVSDSVRESVSARLERVGFGWLAEPQTRKERLERLRIYPSVRDMEESDECVGTPLYMAPEVFS